MLRKADVLRRGIRMGMQQQQHANWHARVQHVCHVRNPFQTELNRTKTMQIELSPVGCTIQNNLLALR